MAPPDHPTATNVAAYARDHHIQIDTLSRDEVCKRYPSFRPNENTIGLLEPNAGFLHVEACVEAHLAAARRAGADLRPHTPMQSWRAADSAVRVETPTETLEAAFLVLALGAYSPPFIDQSVVPLVPRRAMQFWFEAQESYRNIPAFAFVDGKDFIYGFPKLGNEGVKVANYQPTSIVTDPAHESMDYEPAELTSVANVVRNNLVGLSPRPHEHRRCLYTMSSDENFVLDRLPGHENVVLATAGSGHAFKFTPVLGELVADLVRGKADDA